MRDLPSIHPGEQLREEFVKPLGLTAYRLAKDIGVPVTRCRRSLPNAAASPPIRRYAWAATLAPLPSFG